MMMMIILASLFHVNPTVNFMLFEDRGVRSSLLCSQHNDPQTTLSF